MWKRQEANGDLVGFMNAGYRRGAKTHRCATGNGSKHEAIEFDAFAALAVAGLRDLPDALATRAIIIRMRRRAPDERVESFRIKFHVPQAQPIRDALEEWCAEASFKLPETPDLPEGVEDRAADSWEPLIAIADVAGADWPARPVPPPFTLLAPIWRTNPRSAHMELLAHIREAFAQRRGFGPRSFSAGLCARDELPHGKTFGARNLTTEGLVGRLKAYGIKSKDVRIGEGRHKGFVPGELVRHMEPVY